MSSKSTIEECILIAEERNGKCLSAEYENAHIKIEWECEFGHRWFAKLNNIKNGSWCKKCDVNNRRLTLGFCIELANKRGGRCLSNEYKNVYTNMEWECCNKHRWFATTNTVKYGCWCPICGSNKLSLNDCIELAKKHDGKCLSTEYKNSKTKIEWQCKNGHNWFASMDNIKSGKWCPKCKFKTQSKLEDILKEIFPNLFIKFNFRDFKWLVGKNNHPMEIDIWIPELKLAIEYDGEQHFRPVYFGGKNKKSMAIKKFKELQKTDCLKNKLIGEHKDEIAYFIRFNYTQSITKDFILDELKRIVMYGAKESKVSAEEIETFKNMIFDRR